MPSPAQIIMGARGLGMGQATTAFPKYEWSLFANPALVHNEEVAFGFYGLRNYGISELMDLAAMCRVPANFGVFSFGFHRYGDNLFNETRLRAGYKNEWLGLHFGFAAHYNHISFGGNYGSGGAIGLDIGVAAAITKDLWVGAKTTNINRPSYSGIEEELAREMALGISYALNEIALLAFDIVKDVEFNPSYRVGLETIVYEDLKGRVGITSEPMTYSLGFGYDTESWEINFAIQKHKLLGISPGLDFIVYL